MDERALYFAAKNIANDETIEQAVKTVLNQINKDLFSATSPEAREDKFQEYKGLERVWKLLGKWAVEADKLTK